MKSSVAALALLATTAHALTLTTPSDVHSASPVTVSWTQDSSDPSSWSLFLVNDVFHNTYAILNPVNNTAGSVTFTLPPVPAGDGYTLQATPLGNLTVLATSGSFSIAAQVSSASASLSTAATGSVSASGSASAPPTPTLLPSGSSLITPSGSAIPTASGSASVSGSESVSRSGSLSGSASGSGAPSPSESPSGAMSLSTTMGPWLAAGLAVIAGAMAL